jgi:hypothetical protein
MNDPKTVAVNEVAAFDAPTVSADPVPADADAFLGLGMEDTTPF